MQLATLWEVCCHYVVTLSFDSSPFVCSELSDEDIRTAIKNSGGVKGSLLIPDAPFELLVTP